MKGKTAMLREEQVQFIEDQSKRFNFSKFVREKLDEYKKLKEGLKHEKTTE